jgi:NitT/TauT family transport system ATP-binding protein
MFDRWSISGICRNESDGQKRSNESAAMPLLEVRDLDKTFTGDNRAITAIDQLSLSVDEHEFVSIVGPSGCGKSTFLHIVGGFEPATGGQVRLNGRPIGAPGPDRGMMFQELSLFPWLTAIENVAWPLEMQGLPKRARLAKASEYLDLVHLSRFADLYPGQLSGGMKQRVALARLFALDPDVMLMDEPFGALDSQTRELLQEELQSIWRRARKTALFVTHDIDEAIYLGTRLIVFTARPGRIKADIRIPDVDRSGDYRKSPEYLGLRVRVWDLLRDEVLKARAMEET